MLPKLNTIRSAASKWLSVAAIALLGYCAIVLAFAWFQASADGAIPERWAEYHGNHGPWRHYLVGRELVENALFAPLGAFCAAVIGFVARPSKKLAALAGFCLLTLYAVAATHVWLVD